MKLIRARSKELDQTDEEPVPSSESNEALNADSTLGEGEFERGIDRQSSVDTQGDPTRLAVRTLMDAICSSMDLVSSVKMQMKELRVATTLILVEVTRMW